MEHVLCVDGRNSSEGLSSRIDAFCCCGGAPGHDEELAHHPRTLTNVLLHKLRSRNTNERAVGVVSNSTSQQRLASACTATTTASSKRWEKEDEDEDMKDECQLCCCSDGWRTWRTIEEHALGLGDAQALKELRVFDGKLYDFFDFFDLLGEAAHHLVGGVGHLLDPHEGNERVDLVGQNLVEGVAVIAQSHAGVGRELRDVDFLVKINHVLAFRMHLRFGGKFGGGGSTSSLSREIGAIDRSIDSAARLLARGCRGRGDYLDKHLGLAHHFHHFAHVGRSFVQQHELFPEQAHCGSLSAQISELSGEGRGRAPPPRERTNLWC